MLVRTLYLNGQTVWSLDNAKRENYIVFCYWFYEHRKAVHFKHFFSQVVFYCQCSIDLFSLCSIVFQVAITPLAKNKKYSRAYCIWLIYNLASCCCFFHATFLSTWKVKNTLRNWLHWVNYSLTASPVVSVQGDDWRVRATTMTSRFSGRLPTTRKITHKKAELGHGELFTCCHVYQHQSRKKYIHIPTKFRMVENNTKFGYRC